MNELFELVFVNAGTSLTTFDNKSMVCPSYVTYTSNCVLISPSINDLYLRTSESIKSSFSRSDIMLFDEFKKPELILSALCKYSFALSINVSDICFVYPSLINVLLKIADIVSFSLFCMIDDNSVISFISLGNSCVISLLHGVYKSMKGCPTLSLYRTCNITSSPCIIGMSI